MIAAGLWLVLLLCLPIHALADETSFTVSLVPSSDHVLPGETFQLYVVIGNDGWPDTGEVEVASFQTHLSYDKEKVSYQDMAVNQGTFAQFEEETGLIAGFGEKQVFEKDLDYAVLTMKMADNAEGDVSFALDGLVMGKQDASELSGALAPGITVAIGNGGESASHYAGNGGGSLGAGTVGLYGLSIDNPLNSGGSGSSGNGNNSSQKAANNGGASAADQGSASGENVQAGTAESGGQETADGSSADGSAQQADGTEVPGSKAENASVEAHGSPLPTIAGILAVLAAAAAAAAYWMKGQKKEYEKKVEDIKTE